MDYLAPASLADPGRWALPTEAPAASSLGVLVFYFIPSPPSGLEALIEIRIREYGLPLSAALRSVIRRRALPTEASAASSLGVLVFNFIPSPSSELEARL
jgi:hypothetical protein